MEIPLELAWRDIEKQEEVEALIHEEVDHLDKMCHELISCRVTLEKPHQHQDKGNPYRVRIVARIPPGKELVVTRDSTKGALHDRLYTVVKDAFQALTRQIRETRNQQRNHVKRHPEQETQGIVVRLFPEQDYGFLKTPSEREIYFHRNAVANDEFNRLKPGTGVRFNEEMGEQGPQATVVQIVNKPGVQSAKTGEETIEAEPPLGWEE